MPDPDYPDGIPSCLDFPFAYDSSGNQLGVNWDEQRRRYAARLRDQLERHKADPLNVAKPTEGEMDYLREHRHKTGAAPTVKKTLTKQQPDYSMRPRKVLRKS